MNVLTLCQGKCGDHRHVVECPNELCTKIVAIKEFVIKPNRIMQLQVQLPKPLPNGVVLKIHHVVQDKPWKFLNKYICEIPFTTAVSVPVISHQSYYVAEREILGYVHLTMIWKLFNQGNNYFVLCRVFM